MLLPDFMGHVFLGLDLASFGMIRHFSMRIGFLKMFGLFIDCSDLELVFDEQISWQLLQRPSGLI